MVGAATARTMGPIMWVVDAPKDTDEAWQPKEAM